MAGSWLQRLVVKGERRFVLGLHAACAGRASSAAGVGGFPVDARPRAVVMVGGGVQRPPAQTDAETHRLQIGSYRITIKLSRSRMRMRRDGYRVISAAAAGYYSTPSDLLGRLSLVPVAVMGTARHR